MPTPLPPSRSPSSSEPAVPPAGPPAPQAEAASPPAPPDAEPREVGAFDARVAELEAALAAARAEAAEQRAKAESYLDLLQRTQADFLNYKRRREQERAAEAEATQAELLRQLLPVLDDLERALTQVPAELRGHPWVEGMPLIARRLRLALAEAGLTRVGAPGEPFDPRWHEAVAYEPHPDYAEGQIAAVVRPGYRLGDRVVRPAQVTVAAGRPRA
jgi:molecular chaperone GrpE